MEVERFTVETDKITHDFNIAVITDLHLRGGGQY